MTEDLLNYVNQPGCKELLADMFMKVYGVEGDVLVLLEQYPNWQADFDLYSEQQGQGAWDFWIDFCGSYPRP